MQVGPINAPGLAGVQNTQQSQRSQRSQSEARPEAIERVADGRRRAEESEPLTPGKAREIYNGIKSRLESYAQQHVGDRDPEALRSFVNSNLDTVQARLQNILEEHGVEDQGPEFGEIFDNVRSRIENARSQSTVDRPDVARPPEEPGPDAQRVIDFLQDVRSRHMEGVDDRLQNAFSQHVRENGREELGQFAHQLRQIRQEYLNNNLNPRLRNLYDELIAEA